MIDKMLRELYCEFRDKESKGVLANFIPELSNGNPRNFGIVLTTVDGHQFAYGDTEVDFTM